MLTNIMNNMRMMKWRVTMKTLTMKSRHRITWINLTENLKTQQNHRNKVQKIISQMKEDTRAQMTMARIPMIKTRRLIRMFLLRRKMITRNLEPPLMIMMYGGLLYIKEKGHLTYRAWLVIVNTKKLQTTARKFKYNQA